MPEVFLQEWAIEKKDRLAFCFGQFLLPLLVPVNLLCSSQVSVLKCAYEFQTYFFF